MLADEMIEQAHVKLAALIILSATIYGLLRYLCRLWKIAIRNSMRLVPIITKDNVH